jgi:signal transduction histidine kinase
MASPQKNSSSTNGATDSVTTIAPSRESRLARHLIRRNDNEKARLAREMHDELGSNLTAVNLDVAAVEDKLKATDPAMAARLRRALDSLRTVVSLSRRIIEDLRPSAIDNMDLAEALRGYCEDFTERTGLECALELTDDIGQIGRDRAIALFRVAQESLENAASHARPSTLALLLAREAGGVRLLVTDDGTGMPDDAYDRPASHGLLEMRERIAMLGGTLEITSGKNGRGTQVNVFVPGDA